jgi:hypothetical protein
MFQFMMCMATSGKEQEDVEDVGVVASCMDLL